MSPESGGSRQWKCVLRRRWPLLTVVALTGAVIWVSPHPSGVSDRAWHLFAIFSATILGIILKPLPMGAMAFLGLTVTIVTRVLSPAEAMSGFSDPTIWLIVSAFFISRGFIKTGLGTRLAYLFIAALGRKTLGLAYGLVATDLAMAPVIPSNTARSGGVVFPIVIAIAETLGSRPRDGTGRDLGAFLILTAYQGAMLTSAMFLTGTTGNLVTVRLAALQGIPINWGTWFLAALVPCTICLLLMPLLVMRVYPPRLRHTPEAASFARLRLAEMGRVTSTEWLMLAVLATLLMLWSFGSRLGGIEASTASLIGLGLLLLSGVLTWDDVLSEHGAWDTLVWFAALVAMAGYLNTFGLIPWFSAAAGAHLQGHGWQLGFLGLSLVYFYSHYLFASSTAHATAMYAAFLATAIVIGTPPLFAALLLAFFNALLGGITHYGGGPAPVFFGSGYVEVHDWWWVGGVVSVINILIWGIIGGLWWKLLGIV